MNILNLPNDIIYHIYQFIPFQQLRLLNTSIYDNFLYNKVNNTLILSSNKISLYYKLRYHQLNLFQEFNTILNDSYFDVINNPYGSSTGINFNGYCILYSPIYQYGLCRFCNKNLSEHKYDKLIKVYLSLGNKNY